jgi:hypothetical protein
MIVDLIRKKKGAGKWHINHQMAMCLAAADLAFDCASLCIRSVTVSIDEDRWGAFDAAKALQNAFTDQAYVDWDDICQTCLQNLKVRLKPSLTVSK